MNTSERGSRVEKAADTLYWKMLSEKGRYLKATPHPANPLDDITGTSPLRSKFSLPMHTKGFLVLWAFMVVLACL